MWQRPLRRLSASQSSKRVREGLVFMPISGISGCEDVVQSRDGTVGRTGYAADRQTAEGVDLSLAVGVDPWLAVGVDPWLAVGVDQQGPLMAHDATSRRTRRR